LATILSFGVLVLLTIFISLWAHKAEKNQPLRTALYVVTAAISVVTLIVGITSAVINLTGSRGSISLTSGLIIAVAAAIGLPLIGPLRRLLARVMPFDPNSPADMIGLSVLLATAVFVGGTSLLASGDLEISSVSVLELISQAVALILIAFFGIGFLIERDFRGSLKRLGIQAIEPRDVWIALGVVVILFIVTILGSALTIAFQPGLEDQIDKNLGTMTQNLSSFSGALMLGISAGLGEEILFRGAIQPRYGLVFTSIVFALLHVQYGFSFTILSIFGVSLILGYLRQRINTSASIISHIVYDVIAVLLSVAGGGGGT
jgi:membrane protease YdiL (CAAX protease family)